ncbi:MAG: T9SS type A sorting domain-containing protein, partial [Bacteroidota bacterium]
PTSNNIIIENSHPAVIEILNIEGQLIKCVNANENSTTMDISNLSSGVYIIKVTTDKKILIKKFMKQ